MLLASCARCMIDVRQFGTRQVVDAAMGDRVPRIARNVLRDAAAACPDATRNSRRPARYDTTGPRIQYVASARSSRILRAGSTSSADWQHARAVGCGSHPATREWPSCASADRHGGGVTNGDDGPNMKAPCCFAPSTWRGRAHHTRRRGTLVEITVVNITPRSPLSRTPAKCRNPAPLAKNRALLAEAGSRHNNRKSCAERPLT